MPNWMNDPAMVMSFVMSALAVATVFALAWSLNPRDRPEARLAKVTDSRERMFARMKRDRAQGRSLRDEILRISAWQTILGRLRLGRIIEQPDLRQKLIQAGWRSPRHALIFTFVRLAGPPIMALLAVLYAGLNPKLAPPGGGLVLIGLVGAAVGYWLPGVLVKNAITRRRQALMKQFPDALDLMLICVEAGQSIEAAFNRVAQDLAAESPEMAEECGLTAAELAFISDRATAIENLGKRSDLAPLRALSMALVQAERYGTPISQALRVAAQEGRDFRMARAEEKAAALPPKLTVPMILFFLPVLFIVMIGPTVIQLMARP